MRDDNFHIETLENPSHIKISGAFDIYHINAAGAVFAKIKEAKQRLVIDLSELTHLDTAGAMQLHDMVAHHNAKIEGLNAKYQPLLNLISETPIEPPQHHVHRSSFVLLMEHLGKGTIAFFHKTAEIISFFGQSCIALTTALLNPRKLRIGAIVSQIEQIGINAIPIVGLMAFLISIVLAYQGVAQLRPLGAQQFTVNLIAISVLREMGVLLTAIMVAGRSGSAFTAEIGVMKLREEIDALKAIGIDPFEILVVPRLIALIICLPLLAFLADILGLLGGAALSLSLIGISLPEYLDRVQHAVKLHTFVIGMVKAPVFAFAIGVVGCLHGMKVSGSSESVGKETTSSVVESIFIVLMLDAAFSILFEKMGI